MERASVRMDVISLSIRIMMEGCDMYIVGDWIKMIVHLQGKNGNYRYERKNDR